MASMTILSTRGGIPIRQTKLAPDGLEFSKDVSEARWVEESLSAFGTLRSLLPDGFAAYARVFHPAYLNKDEERPVRWSTVASWTGRTVHPLMQFERIAGLSEDPHDMYKDPPWGSHPKMGSIPERECRTLVEVLRSFTSAPGNCFFCLWEGYGNIDTRLYKASSRGESSGAGLPAIPRAYRRHHGIHYKGWAFLGEITECLVAGGQGLVCGNRH